jgi:hypothetical protein
MNSTSNLKKAILLTTFMSIVKGENKSTSDLLLSKLDKSAYSSSFNNNSTLLSSEYLNRI